LFSQIASAPHFAQSFFGNTFARHARHDARNFVRFAFFGSGSRQTGQCFGDRLSSDCEV
jgi:hypothetical protein